MTVTVQKFQGNRPRIDGKYWTTSATPQGVTTTGRSTMDPKEIEDRMAAAEALSSLGLPATFPGANTTVPAISILQSDSEPAGEKIQSVKSRTKERGRGKSEQRETGRETKSRSSRGRGRGRGSATTESGGSGNSVSSVTLNVPQVSVPHVLPISSLPSSALGHFSLPLTSITDSAHVQIVHAANATRGRRKNTKNVGKGEKTSQAGTTQQQIGLRGGPGVAFHLAGSQGFEHTLSDRTNLHTGAHIIPVVSFASLATAAAAPQGHLSDAEQFPRITPVQSAAVALPTTVAATCLPVSAASGSGTPSENLPSLSLSVTLPSLSLGSIGLTSLPSIPNLPSLPNAIASLQLNSTVQTPLLPDLLSPEAQLSPQPRDSSDKSLPLKKRKIVESVSGTPPLPSTFLSISSATSPVASPQTLPTTSSFPPISQPSVTTTATAKAETPTPFTIDGPAETAEKQIETPAQVVSPGPTPAALLSQVLPPAISLQLLSEINTAITPDEDGDLPLHIAVVHENDMMVKKLIQLMGLVYRSVDRYNKQQQTPLHLAIKLAYLPGIQLLLDAGADPNLVDSSGSTSIHMAVQGRDPDCLEALLQWSKHRCDLNYRNFEGMAPLHTAVMNNDIELVKKLLDHGADINIMDGKSGRTVLFHAAEGNQKPIVELLLRRGADPEIANYAGVIPTMAAQGRSHTSVARILARAVDEGLDDVGEDMETQSPPALEIAVSEDSSDSSKPAAMDRVKGSMAGVLSDMAARVSSAQSQSRSQALSSGKSYVQLKGQTLSTNEGQGESTTGVATAMLHPGVKLPSQSVLQENCVLDGKIKQNFKLGPSPEEATILKDSTMKDHLNIPIHKEGDAPRLNMGMLGSNACSMDVDESGVPQASLAKVIQNLIIKAWTEKQNGGENAEARESPKPVVTSAPATALQARLAGLTSVTPGVSQVGMVTTPAEHSLKLVPISEQSAVRVSSFTPVMPVVASPSAAVSDKVSSGVLGTLPSVAHTQATRPLFLFRSSTNDPSGSSGGSVELRHVTPDDLLALRQSPTNSVRPSLNTQPSSFQHLRSFLASSGIPLSRMNALPSENSQSKAAANHIIPDNLGVVKAFYEPDDVADQPKDYSLKSRKGEGTSVVKSDSEPVKNWSGGKQSSIAAFSEHSKEKSSVEKTDVESAINVVAGQGKNSCSDPTNPEKGKKTKSKASRSKQNATEKKVKRESKLNILPTEGASSSTGMQSEVGSLVSEQNGRLTSRKSSTHSDPATHPMVLFSSQQNTAASKVDPQSSIPKEQPMEMG